MVLICHVISENQVTQEPYDPYTYEGLKVNHHSAKFDGHRHCGSGNIMALVHHVISQDHVIKHSCDYMAGYCGHINYGKRGMVLICNLI